MLALGYVVKSPVLFLIFNRPETTAQVFAAIRQAKPPKLYISADGPRAGRPDDQERCAQARSIATAVDWPCEVQTLFRDKNLGCKLGVSSGIDWFFQNETEGIILEDDVLPMPSFFTFCDEMLERYRDDPTIGMITGSNLVSKRVHPKGVGQNTAASYFVTAIPLIWGWATWRRAWQKYDLTMSTYPNWLASSQMQQLFHGDALVMRYWQDALDRVYQGKQDTWDYQWLFACWSTGMKSIIPANNLTDNLGYGMEATHTSATKPACLIESIPSDLSFPLIHPKHLQADWQVDRLMFKRIHGIHWWGYLRRQLRPLKKTMQHLLGKGESA